MACTRRIGALTVASPCMEALLALKVVCVSGAVCVCARHHRRVVESASGAHGAFSRRATCDTETSSAIFEGLYSFRGCGFEAWLAIIIGLDVHVGCCQNACDLTFAGRSSTPHALEGDVQRSTFNFQPSISNLQNRLAMACLVAKLCPNARYQGSTTKSKNSVACFYFTF